MTVTGSNLLIDFTTARNASLAGVPSALQMSGLFGQAIQQPAWGAYSAGIFKLISESVTVSCLPLGSVIEVSHVDVQVVKALAC
jgi:hypothetical protein